MLALPRLEVASQVADKSCPCPSRFSPQWRCLALAFAAASAEHRGLRDLDGHTALDIVRQVRARCGTPRFPRSSTLLDSPQLTH